MPSQGLSLHVATLLTGLLECLGFAGVLFGWASLVFVFKTEHCFEDLCEPSTGLMSNATGHDDCKAQDEKSSLILTLASFTNNFMTFPTGYIFDRFKTTVTRLIAMQLLLLPLEPGSSASAAALSSAVSSLTLMSLPCLGFALCASVPVLPLQYVTFILQVISLSFLYGGNAAFLTPAFPAEHFGKLFGLVMTLSAIVSLLQFPIFTLTKGPFQNNLFCVNMMLALVTLLTFVHPFLVHRECQQEATPATTA